MQPIIKVENLGKKYTIRHEHPERYTALRDVMARQVKKLFSFPKHLRPSAPATDYEEFWALKDINFEIQQGDRVGIIGRNGAGKSTLLKILSRITEPSTGRIELNGRVASLLEVGTGFHPELTGRENIYLNGAILGMSRAEIRRKFDEIVDFSGVEKFLDTPVKRYSSGMYVRLAFAVAAHLEPEILVVDEVLAVGDAEFQKKCLGKMEDVSKNEGRTVLFVSHNLLFMKELCPKGILLKNGKTEIEAGINEVIKLYSEAPTLLDLSEKRLYDFEKNGIKIIDFFIYNSHLEKISSLMLYEDLQLCIVYEVSLNINIAFGFEIRNEWNQIVGKINTPLFELSTGYYNLNLKMNKMQINTGTYFFDFYLIENGVSVIASKKEILTFEIDEDERLSDWKGEWKGVIRPIFELKNEKK